MIMKENVIMEENMILIRDLKAFQFNFDWPKNIDENLKYENEFMIKSNESLAENKIKSEIEHLLLRCKHANDIHEHIKTVKRITHINLFLTCYKGQT